ncbi:MAG: HAMP domain-containing protein [Proteobacteria bacterium]|nr:HAMP domain-containing protein [Pseudomonadota bacterium]MBU1452055.1 HAMP domain-containing protein [Pseudomonadota bacterium]MBU2468038.1 HAMP domain-containing protein [Pseudomonadota bacterium]
MADTAELERSKEIRRRKRERIIIVITLILVAAITYAETQVVDLAQGQPLASSLLVFALINVNALLLLLVIFLVFRNLVKMTMERRKGIWGARLRTKLVGTFVLLSLAPTILVLFAAFQFVGASMEYWFSAQVEKSLFDAMEISDAYSQQLASESSHFAGVLATELQRRGYRLSRADEKLDELLESRRALFDLAGAKVFSDDLKILAQATQSGTHASHLQGLPMEMISRSISTGLPLTHLQPAPTGDFAAAIQPVLLPRKDMKPKVVGAVVAFQLLPPGALARSQQVRKGLEGYRQLKAFKEPIRTNLFITLSIVTLLIVFVATWLGFRLARTITDPLREVAEGTQRVAGGDYDFDIAGAGPDEIGTLVNAFNRMTADLKTSKARLDEAQSEMRRTNLELDRRRRYMEIVLRSVAAGVITVDAEGKASTINPSAERLLKVRAAKVLGRPWRELVDGENRALVERMLTGLIPGGAGTIDQQVRLAVGGESLSLMVHLGLLKDEKGTDLGMVVVFEDLSELEKAQRMAAWREVARRIAHEVKNPLTPIKLSAQRLMRRYGGQVPEGDTVFDECTRTIVQQVEELRRLVNEFSTFARLPAANPAPADLTTIAADAVSLFKSAHPEVSLEMEVESKIPIFELDREQMSRVLINLLDNAVAAVQKSEPPRQVVLRLSYDEILNMVRLEVEDSGPGVSPEDKIRLFEPYFSTKKGGTGLGLTIVSTIVADHNGYVRVQDNQPTGARLIVELPARGARGT